MAKTNPKALTELGKLLAVLRIIHNETMRGQAERLEISAAYLCDVSKGNRNLSKNLAVSIIKNYILEESQIQIILEAFIGKEVFERALEIECDLPSTDSMVYLFLGEKI